MFWKVYFFFWAIITIPSYLFIGLSRIWETIDCIIFIIILIGIFGFSWKKKIFVKSFWQAFFPVMLIWNVVYHYFIPVDKSILEMGGGVSQTILGHIIFIIFLPGIIALFLYAFKRLDLWNEKLVEGDILYCLCQEKFK